MSDQERIDIPKSARELIEQWNAGPAREIIKRWEDEGEASERAAWRDMEYSAAFLLAPLFFLAALGATLYFLASLFR